MNDNSITYKNFKLFGLVSLIVIVCDQLTKAMALKYLDAGISYACIPYVLDLKLVHNPGAAWGLGSGKRLGLILFAVLVLLVAIDYIRKEKSLPTSLIVCISAVASGGVSNALDRVVVGEVTDFLSCAFINFPVFNVADIAISLGCIIGFIIFLIWDKRREDASKETRAGHQS